MIVRWITSLSLGLAITLAAASAQQTARALKTEKELRSYAFGMETGNQMRKLGIDLDPAAYAQGLGDALAGRQTLISEAEAKAAVAREQLDYKRRQILSSPTPGPQRREDGKQAGEAFLAANAKKAGVVTMPSGLQYKVIKTGTGRKPTPADTVVCRYRGTLVDGAEFDSSYARNQDATFAVNRVIAGWTQALQLMPVGSKWQLFIPPALAYGAAGTGDKIGPNATLIFELELLSIK